MNSISSVRGGERPANSATEDEARKEELTGARFLSDVDWEACNEFLCTDSAPSEAELVQAALCACQGLNGEILTFNVDSLQYDVAPGYNVPPWETSVLQTICQIGVSYRRIKSWVKPEVEAGSNERPRSPAVLAFATALEGELIAYEFKVASLSRMARRGAIPWDKGQWRQNVIASRLREAGATQSSNSLSSTSTSTSSSTCSTRLEPNTFAEADQATGYLCLRGLSSELYQWRCSLKEMEIMVDTAKSLEGGQLLDALNRDTNHGLALVLAPRLRLLHAAMGPLCKAALHWVSRGDLGDLGQLGMQGKGASDLFVEAQEGLLGAGAGSALRQRQSSSGGSSSSTSSGTAAGEPLDVWHKGFRFLQDSVPTSLIPLDLALRIFRTGKSLYFLVHVCGDRAATCHLARQAAGEAEQRERAKGVPKEQEVEKRIRGDVALLREVEAAVSVKVEARLVEVMLSRFLLLQHCRLRKDYYLFQRGDYAQAFVMFAGPELSKPAKAASEIVLAGTLEAAIRLSQPTAEEQQLLPRLRARLQNAPNLSGWDTFWMDYFVEPPLKAVLTRDCLAKQHRIMLRVLLLLRLDATLSLLDAAHHDADSLRRRLSAAAAAASSSSSSSSGPPSARQSGAALGRRSSSGTLSQTGTSMPRELAVVGSARPVPVEGGRLSSQAAEQALAEQAQGRRPSGQQVVQQQGPWMGIMRLAYKLRQDTVFVLQLLQEHVMVGTISTAWEAFTKQVQSAVCLEDVITSHGVHVSTVHTLCFVGPSGAEQQVGESLKELMVLVVGLNSTLAKIQDEMSAPPRVRRSHALALDEAAGQPVEDKGVQSCHQRLLEHRAKLGELTAGLARSVAKCQAAMEAGDGSAGGLGSSMSSVMRSSLDHLVSGLRRLSTKKQSEVS